MPTSVETLFENVGLSVDGRIPWGASFVNAFPGVYVISLSDQPSLNQGTRSLAPISVEAVQRWIDRVPDIELDKKTPTVHAIQHRLAEFWFPDENILYIGMTSKKLCTRIRDYYDTPLGDSRPHAGGHWLKTLSNLSGLHVYYATTERPKDVEKSLLGYFVRNVSGNNRAALYDPVHPFPFANLEYPPGTRKKHGIGKSTL